MFFLATADERGRRLNGVASVDEHDELMEHYPEAQFVVRVRAREVLVGMGEGRPARRRPGAERPISPGFALALSRPANR
jgi:hypothetical protein